MQEIKKVVILGPESTGKSTLALRLAEHYNIVWCEEYAREYLIQHGTDYTYDDLLEIAKGQLALEDEYTKKVNDEWSMVNGETLDFELQTSNLKPLIIDTNMYVMKVWCEFVFGKCHQFILDQIEERKYDLYLLCNIDLPWVHDDLREYPDIETRKKLYDIYKTLLLNQHVPWVNIRGNYEERKALAVEAINKLSN